VSIRNYDPEKKYSTTELRSDYSLLQNILEQKHPSLYWYTSRDTMDRYFNYFRSLIRDSMTEHQFAWHIVAPLVDKIHCGHTSVSMSRKYAKWIIGKRIPSFPLYMKIWNDSMAVTGNLNRKDSTFKRGTIITSVNGMSARSLTRNMFNFLPEDGRANNINYIRLSANFPYYHRNIFGTYKSYQVKYIDNTGNERSTDVPVFIPTKDTTKIKKDSLKAPERMRPPKAPRIEAYRSFNIDSGGKFATITLNTFSKGRLRGFFRRSFKTMKQKNIDNLVLDIRSNGGGRVGLSTLLTKYISRTPFKVADSLYAKAKSLGRYTKYIKGGHLNNLEMFFISKKNKDGNYHINHLEKKFYKPRKKYHYDGSVYVLTNGPTFSAATLFANTVKGQEGILIAGEETGGGWHGNSGIMIPDIKLPETGIRVRLPLYRLVQFNHVPKTGTGIIPDLYIGTSYQALLQGIDKKMQVIRELIDQKENLKYNSGTN